MISKFYTSGYEKFTNKPDENSISDPTSFIT